MPSELLDLGLPASEITEVIAWIQWRDEKAKEDALEEKARASLNAIARDPKEDQPTGPKVLGRK